MVAPALNQASNVIPPVPSPEPGDSDEVSLALVTARAVQKRGDLSEAIRWIRRAVDAAERDGDDERVLALARLAAEMASAVVAPTPPAPALAAPSAVPEPISVPPSSTVIRRAPPPLPPVATAPAKAPISAPAPKAAPRMEQAKPQTDHPRKPDLGKVLTDLADLSAEWSVVRVSIESTSGDPSSVSIRRLESGKPPPRGSKEAFLVLPGRSVNPFGNAE